MIRIRKSEKSYIIVSSQDVNYLEEEVNVFIEKGYKPKGGIAISDDHGDFYQAMYKEFKR
jgi:hypothetical protein